MTKVTYCEKHQGVGPFEHEGFHYYVAPANTYVKVTWDDAQEYVKTLGEGWRLPTIDELDNIVYKNKAVIDATDTITDNPLSDMAGGYVWSSTEGGSNGAWYQRMSDGIIGFNGYKNREGWVIAVKRVAV